MQITVEKNITRLKRPLHHQLRMIVGRVKLGAAPNPLSVQVRTQQRAAVVAHNHTVGVQHGNNFENEGVSQKLGLFFIPDQHIDHATHNPRGIGFPWVHSRSQNYRFPHCNIDRVT